MSVTWPLSLDNSYPLDSSEKKAEGFFPLLPNSVFQAEKRDFFHSSFLIKLEEDELATGHLKKRPARKRDNSCKRAV